MLSFAKLKLLWGDCFEVLKHKKSCHLPQPSFHAELERNGSSLAMVGAPFGTVRSYPRGEARNAFLTELRRHVCLTELRT